MRNRLHRLYLGFVLSFILHERSEICDSPFIIINDIQTNLLLEHLVKERKMTLNITGAFPTEKGDSAMHCHGNQQDFLAEVFTQSYV